MNRLLSIGFQRAGAWTKDGKSIRCEIQKLGEEKDVLYTFIVDGDVKYVGKTIRQFKRRMYEYGNPGPNQRTSLRVNALLRDALWGGATVDTFALPDKGLLHFGVFQINLAEGLEKSIIETLKPDWNIQGARPRSPVSLPDEGLGTLLESVPTGVFSVRKFAVTIGKACYTNGFFNVPKKYEEHFGQDGDPLEVFFEDAKLSVEGYVNRRANPSGTPRLMIGSPYTKWVQRRCDIGGRINVEVLSKNSIRVRP